MATAKKLPSGNWRILVYANGHRKSFTAPTKKNAEYQASQWLMTQNDSEDMTIKVAIDRFINNRSAVLSPTTIEGYTAINLHPWSMSYQDAVKLVSLLDENVVVVTADDFIRLITENVPHEDVVLSGN